MSKPLVYVVIQFVIFVLCECRKRKAGQLAIRLVRVMCRYLSRTTFLSVLLATNICSIIYILSTVEDSFNDYDYENHEAAGKDIFMADTELEKEENNEEVNRHVELEEQSGKNRQRVFFPHADHVPESKY